MRALFAIAVACLLSGPALAHGRLPHHARRHHARHHVMAVLGPRRRVARHDGSARPALRELLHNARAHTPLARTALRFNGARRDPTGFRGEWCGDFMGFVARLSGRRVPPGYRMAREWVHAGPRVAPQPDAVMVMSHHVGIVMRVIGRFVELISGNHSHRVGIGLYPISRAIAFVHPVRS